jgi:putative peptidoglycan lipid II flippase
MRAQRLFGLPVTLFGTAVAIPELPELSRVEEGSSRARAVVERTARSFRQTGLVLAPAVVGTAVLGYHAVSLVFQRGRFGVEDCWAVYLTLLAYVPGMVPSAATRLLQNPYYAEADTRTPALVAGGRIVVTVLAAVPLMVALDRVRVAEVVGAVDAGTLTLGAVGLALGSSLGAWFELGALVRGLRRRIGDFSLPWRAFVAPSALALFAAVPAWGVRLLALERLPTALADLTILTSYGVVYGALALLLDVGGARSLARRLARRGPASSEESGTNRGSEP